jgi:outer membrane protein assembly factor BamB
MKNWRNKNMNKYTLKIFMICLTLLLVSASQPALGSDWAKFQKDVYNMGVTADSAPITNPTLCPFSWSYTLASNVNTAPLVFGDMMYIIGGNKVYAFNKTAGGLAWSQSTSGGVLGTATVGNGTIFVPTSDGKIFALDIKTGSSKWSKTVGSGKQLDTPITYSGEKIYFGEAMGGHKYYCYDENGTEIWNRTATTKVGSQGSYYWAGAAVIGNSLVYGDDDGHLVSANKDTGTNTSEIDVSSVFRVTCGNIRSSILYVEDLKRIYFTSKGGYCYALGFNPSDGTFNTSNKYIANIGTSTSTPAYYKGRIYVGAGSIGGGGSGIACLDADLSQIWRYSSGQVQSSPAISTYYDNGDGTVYIYFTVNGNPGGIYCLKDFTGCTSPILAWSYANASQTQYSLGGAVISDGWVYFGTNNKYTFGFTTEIPLKANFTSNVTNGTAPLVVQFTDNSTGNATSWAWDFDNDGNVDSSEQNPLYTYNVEGNYTVKLTVSNGNGSDVREISDMITVGPKKATAPADAWYQFHKDALHIGYTSSKAPDSANLAWTAKPLDSAYSLVPSSSVAIAEGNVFGLCNGPTDDWGNPLTPYGQLVAFDESTGKEVWNVTVAAPEWGSWSSPAYDDRKVFASAGNKTYCVNASTGEVIWTFHNPSNFASCNGGPSIGDGKIFASDCSGGNYYCLDENTGTLLWTFKLDGTYAQATPSYKDGKVYLSSLNYSSVSAVYCVNATNGELFWKNEGFISCPCGSITITDDGLYVTVYGFGSSDGIYKLDQTDGHVVWGRPDVSPSDSTPTVIGGKVYLSAGCYGYSDPKTYCLDASDGHTLWETNASDKIGDWICSPAVADGKVFIGGVGAGLFNGCGELFALNAETGAMVWNYTGCGCSPAIADNMVFSIGGGKLYAFKEREVVSPVANFTATPTSGDAPLTVNFTDQSTGSPTSWSWDFGDGANATGQSVSHTYAAAGNYTVNLTISNAGGSDSEIKTDYIVVTSQETSDTTNPVIDSADMFPANTTAGSTINISVNATDNVELVEVTAGNVALVKDSDGIWKGSITALSSVGSYSLSIKAKDAAGNTAESSVPYRVLQRSGGASIAASPKSSNVAAGSNVSLNIKVKNTQNIDDTFKVRISVSELPAAYQANLSWFNWTEKLVTLKAGQEFLIPIKVNVPDGTAAGRKLFRANVNSETSTLTGFDTGYLVIA